MEKPTTDERFAEPRPRRSAWQWIPWALLLLLGAATGVFFQMLYRPAVNEVQRCGAEIAVVRREAGEAVAAQKATDTQLAETKAQLDDAKAQLEGTRTELATAQTELEKSSAQKADDAQLIAQLKTELGGGNGDVANAGNAITVTMVDRILFRSGEAEMTPEGEAVLRRLGGVLRERGKLVEVSGHADTTPVKSEIKALFPTNWELSTARATHVVRFLEEQVGLSPRILKAAGYGSARPVASNATAAGRAKNRRIEILLLPDNLKVVKGGLAAAAKGASAPSAPASTTLTDKERLKAIQAGAAAGTASKTPAKVAASTKKPSKR